MTGASDPVRRPQPLLLDGAIAAVLTALAVVLHAVGSTVDVDPPHHAQTWWTYALVVAATAPILLRRRAPFWAFGLVIAGQITCEVLRIFGPSWIAALVAVYSVGKYTDGRRRAKVVATGLAAVLVLVTLGVIEDEVTLVDSVALVGLLTAAFVVGDNLRRRRLHVEGLADRAERAERERDLLARERVAEERNRIARELHDIVAHSVSVMVIQASAARRNLTTRPAEATELLTNVERTGRQTMDELRQVLGVLRGDDGMPVAGPVPTLHDLPTLVDSAGSLPVALTVSGDVELVPAGVAVSVYRIVQEALTNANRHAGPVARVTVDVTCSAADVTIAVDDDGRGASGGRGEPGYGLIGMHERATRAGGTFHAGPRAGGGWRVRATIPRGCPLDARGDTAAGVAATLAS